MKRGGPLKRRTPMKAGKPLARGKGLKRTAMKASPKAKTKAGRHRDRMDELRPIVLARAGYRCQACGNREQPGRWLEAHHRLMAGQGGPDTLENLVALCATVSGPMGCHQLVHARTGWAYDVGLLIRSWQGPPAESWESPADGLQLPDTA